MAILATVHQKTTEPTLWMPALSLAIVLAAFSSGVWVGRAETAERLGRVEEQLAGHVVSGPHQGGVSRDVWLAEIQRLRERQNEILAQIADLRRSLVPPRR
jgi:hypothetical protein